MSYIRDYYAFQRKHWKTSLMLGTIMGAVRIWNYQKKQRYEQV